MAFQKFGDSAYRFGFGSGEAAAIAAAVGVKPQELRLSGEPEFTAEAIDEEGEVAAVVVEGGDAPQTSEITFPSALFSESDGNLGQVVIGTAAVTFTKSGTQITLTSQDEDGDPLTSPAVDGVQDLASEFAKLFAPAKAIDGGADVEVEDDGQDGVTVTAFADLAISDTLPGVTISETNLEAGYGADKKTFTLDGYITDDAKFVAEGLDFEFDGRFYIVTGRERTVATRDYQKGQLTGISYKKVRHEIAST